MSSNIRDILTGHDASNVLRGESHLGHAGQNPVSPLVLTYPADKGNLVP